MNKLPLIVIGPVAALLLTLAAPAHGAQSCSFGGSGGLALAFGALDPSAVGPPTVSANFIGAGTTSASWGSCASTMTMTATSQVTGSQSAWAMKAPDGSTIPYYLTTPTGKFNSGGYTPFTLAAQILGSDYANAVPGSYGDTLTIMVTP